MPSEAASLHDVGALLRLWCQQGGTSQSALAMKVGVSAAHLNQIVHGRARPGSVLAQRIMETLARQRRRRLSLAQGVPASSG